MKAALQSIWFWFMVLILFLTLILYDFDFEREIKAYQKVKMNLFDVHFSELDLAFEHARIYADEVDMDDSQNNMLATNVRALFFDKLVATRSAELVASSASRNAQECVFWNNVRIRTTENERMRTEELRYYSTRREIFTTFPVTIWKDSTIITGRDLRVNTQTKEASLLRDVMIRIWDAATHTAGIPPATATFDQVFGGPAVPGAAGIPPGAVAASMPRVIMIENIASPAIPSLATDVHALPLRTSSSETKATMATTATTAITATKVPETPKKLNSMNATTTTTKATVPNAIVKPLKTTAPASLSMTVDRNVRPPVKNTAPASATVSPLPPKKEKGK